MTDMHTSFEPRDSLRSNHLPPGRLQKYLPENPYPLQINYFEWVYMRPQAAPLCILSADLVRCLEETTIARPEQTAWNMSKSRCAVVVLLPCGEHRRGRRHCMEFAPICTHFEEIDFCDRWTLAAHNHPTSSDVISFRVCCDCHTRASIVASAQDQVNTNVVFAVLISAFFFFSPSPGQRSTEQSIYAAAKWVPCLALSRGRQARMNQ